MMLDVKKTRGAFHKIPASKPQRESSPNLPTQQAAQAHKSAANSSAAAAATTTATTTTTAHTGVAGGVKDHQHHYHHHHHSTTTTAHQNHHHHHSSLTSTSQNRGLAATKAAKTSTSSLRQHLSGTGGLPLRAAPVGPVATVRAAGNLPRVQGAGVATTLSTSTTTTTTTSSTNPVRLANQRFFLVRSYKDPNFLKNEVDFAHSQVVTGGGLGYGSRHYNPNKNSVFKRHKASLGEDYKNNNGAGSSNNLAGRPNQNQNQIRGLSTTTTTSQSVTGLNDTDTKFQNLSLNGVRRTATLNGNQSTATAAATTATGSGSTTTVTNHQQQQAIGTTVTLGVPKVGTSQISGSKLKLDNGGNRATAGTVAAAAAKVATTTQSVVNLVSSSAANNKIKPLSINNNNNNNNNNNHHNHHHPHHIGNSNTNNNSSSSNNIVMNNNNSSLGTSTGNNNNNMATQQQQQQQVAPVSNQHDDITFIDSDETPIVAGAGGGGAGGGSAAVKAALIGSIGTGKVSSGGLSYFKPITPPPLQLRNHLGTNNVSSATGLGGSGGTRSARPKSTIITTSSSNFSSSYEKFNNYKATNGERERERERGDGPTTSSNARRYGIDSVSIKASIEKFNNLSEQKRQPSNLSSSSATNASGSLRASSVLTTKSDIGGGSSSNLQQRYSSDLDSLRMSAGYSSSLTRAGYHRPNAVSSAAVGRLMGTVNNVSGSAMTTALVAPTLSKVSVGGKTAAALVSNYDNTNCATIIAAAQPTTASSSAALGAATSASSVTELSSASTSAQAATGAASLATKVKQHNQTRHQTQQNQHQQQQQQQHSDSNGSIYASASASAPSSASSTASSSTSTPSESARTTAGAARTSSVLPPVSPTSSRYWDRENARSSGTTASSLATSSAVNAIGVTNKHINDDTHSYKSSRDEKSEGLCGLRNIGNTCFMNSVIQCLSHTQELTRYLRSHHGSRSTNTKDQQILNEFAKLIQEMWTANVHTVTPMELKRAFSTKHRMYSDYNQQDAQEFLRFFLDSLHSALNTGVKGEMLNIDDNLSDNKKADLTWEWYARHENSLIRDLFVGQLKSTLKCTTCGNTSVTFDPFWDLSVPLPSSSRCKLEACLDLFIREEVLDGDEMPTCSKCKTRRKCTKSFTIQRFPKYLVIHLKRFSETRWSKLSNIVEFPTGDRELNMGPYGANSNSNVHYSLYAVSNHMGSTAGGHYVALCKHPVARKWHEFNDNIVSEPLPENYLVSSSAYILFYERA